MRLVTRDGVLTAEGLLVGQRVFDHPQERFIHIGGPHGVPVGDAARDVVIALFVEVIEAQTGLKPQSRYEVILSVDVTYVAILHRLLAVFVDELYGIAHTPSVAVIAAVRVINRLTTLATPV